MALKTNSFKKTRLVQFTKIEFAHYVLNSSVFSFSLTRTHGAVSTVLIFLLFIFVRLCLPTENTEKEQF
jgi:hypothetical protein